MLSKIGYEVVTTSDGFDTIESYIQAGESGYPFDAVIMDLTVPGGMGGIEAIEKLKAIDPDVRAIVSSGYSNDPVMSNFREYGFKGVIAKPYRSQELSAILMEVLEE
jgi:CheY-like chemotaxis protein